MKYVLFMTFMTFMAFMTFMTQENVIFDILEPAAFLYYKNLKNPVEF